MKYFTYLPTLQYSSQEARNILARSRVLDFVRENAGVYYKHTIADGERPDILASKYYGNSDYTWLIFYANDIVDPIYDWPLTYRELEDHLISKYGTVEIAKVTPHHYLLEDRFVIDELQFLDPNIPESMKKMVSIFDHEFEQNEAKRDITIIDKQYVRQITNELRRLFI